MTMTVFEVGRPLNGQPGIWPERAEYNYRAGSHILLMTLEKPTAAEVADFARGPVEFALYTQGSVIELAYRFGGQPWSDSSYNWHLVPEAEQQVPELPDNDEQRDLLAVILADARDGTILALRAVTFSPAFTRALREAIRAQSAAPFDRTAHYAQVDTLTRGWTSEQVAAHATARCWGGE